MPTAPYPVPTPWQPPRQGGNRNVPAGLIGRMVPTNFIGPINRPVGATYMTNANNNPWLNYGQTLGASSTNNRSSGGGGGGGAQGLTHEQIMRMGYDENNLPSGFYRADAGNLPDLQSQIDSEYNPIFDTLNQMENDARGGYGDLERTFTGGVDAQRPLLDQAYQEGVAGNNLQQNQNRQNEANVMTEARRLFNELTQGVRQKFGGANSAGDFASAFYGREFQRQAGQIHNTAGQNMQALLEKATAIKEGYDAKLQNLEMQRQTAISQAQEAFRQKIDAINNARLGAQQNKAQLKLDALREMRANINQVTAQATQFQQQLEAQQQAADLNLRNSILGYQQSANQSVDLNPYINPQYSQMQSSQGQTNNNVTGYVDWNRERRNYGTYPQ